jgi:hypothetical protein
MRLLYLAVASIAIAAGAGEMRANAVGADTSGPPKARGDEMRVAQLVPDTAPPEATTGNPSLAPLKWVGMLVIPTPTDKDPNSILECTAQFIKPNVLLTAAHCLRDLQVNPAGPWPDVTKGTFWLQYQNQQGTPFKVLCGAVNPLWAFPANYGALKAAEQADAQRTAFQHDFAMILVDGTSPTGVMPYALDWKGSVGVNNPATAHNGASEALDWKGSVSYVTRVGYAGDILDGQIVQKSGGAVFFADAIPMLPKSYPNIVVQWAPITDLTEGTSGGAWIANFSASEGANTNILIAVTSFQFLAYPGGEGAAYLTSAEFNPLLAFVSNGCK